MATSLKNTELPLTCGIGGALKPYPFQTGTEVAELQQYGQKAKHYSSKWEFLLQR